LARLYTSTSFRPIINDRLDPVFDEKNEMIIVGRTKREQKREGSEGLLDIGVLCEKQATGRSFHGYRVFMDAKFPHIVFICGKRGGGKSYTLGVIAEELARTKIGIGVVVVDPIGIFWSLKKKNSSRKEAKELERWGLKPQPLENVRVLGPLGLYDEDSDILDGPFSIKPSELTSEEWCLVFGINRFKIQGLLIGEALEKVREGYRVRKGPNEFEYIPGKGLDYDIEDIVDVIDRDVDLGSEERGYARATRRSVIARFRAAEKWGIFSREGTPIDEISVWDTVTVIDVSHPKLENQIRALVVGIVAKKILQARMETSRMEEVGLEPQGPKIPVTWLMIDEAHLLIPRKGHTAASKPLIEYAKLGRKPGCALVLATQRPAATDDEILSQVDILIGHSLGLEDDIAALLRRVPAKLPSQIADSDFVRGIPSGFAILADQKTQQRAMIVQIRPRLTHHSGKEATPVKQVPKVEQTTPTSTASTRAGRLATAVAQPVWGEESASSAEPTTEVEVSPDAVGGLSVPSEAGETAVELPTAETPGEEEATPHVELGEEKADELTAKVYADQVVHQVESADSDEESMLPQEAWEEAVEEEPVEETAAEELPDEEERTVGLAALETAEEEASSVPTAPETRETVAAALETPTREGESFPLVLRRDSAQSLAAKRIRVGWTGKPKEMLESVDLVHLPVYEVRLTSERKGILSGRVVLRHTIVVDAHLGEIIVDYRDFKRSAGLSRLAGLSDHHLKVFGLVAHGRLSPGVAEEVGMDEARLREVLDELARRRVLDLSDDREGKIKAKVSKEVKFPRKPDMIKGELPSTSPTRIGTTLEKAFPEDWVESLVSNLYPSYRIEHLRLVYLPYYEITYTFEGGYRKEYLNGFTGLFDELY